MRLAVLNVVLLMSWPILAAEPAASKDAAPKVAETTTASPAVLTSQAADAAGDVHDASRSHVDQWFQTLETGYLRNENYFRMHLLYWEASDPDQDGRILMSTSTSPQSNQFNNGFTTGDPNTTPELGFRATLGRSLNDLWWLELSGHWVHPFDHPLGLRAGVITAGTDVIIDQVFLVPNNSESVAFSAVNYIIRNHGIEGNGRFLAYVNGPWEVMGMGGLRYVCHNEEFDISVGPNPAGTPFVRENFETENSFIVGQLGGDVRYTFCRFASARAGLKIGLGANFQDLNVAGPTAGTGRFTGAANLGTTSRTEYSTVLDFGFGLILHLTPWVDLYAGYDALWFSTVLRATDQLGLPGVVANGAVGPAPMANETLLLGGFNLALEIRY